MPFLNVITSYNYINLYILLICTVAYDLISKIYIFIVYTYHNIAS